MPLLHVTEIKKGMHADKPVVFPMKWPTMMILQVAVHKKVARSSSSWRIWMGLQQHRRATPWVRWVRRCGETRPTRTRWATLRPEWPGWIFGSLLQAMDPSKQSCKESQVHTKEPATPTANFWSILCKLSRFCEEFDPRVATHHLPFRTALSKLFVMMLLPYCWFFCYKKRRTNPWKEHELWEEGIHWQIPFVSEWCWKDSNANVFRTE